jgi:hypothetical protein
MKFLFFTVIVILGFACSSSGKKKLSDSASEKSRLSDEQLLDTVQYYTFQYFWDGAEPNSGLARERYHVDGVYPENDKHIITTGGGGFGVMAILVGIERKFITREQGLERFERIVSFLEKADRFNGVWPHWLDGETGKVKPFSKLDDGADLVESAFLVQGLITVREYFAGGNEREKQLVDRIDKLWREVQWNFHQKDGEKVLYWHWSPNVGWKMNFAVTGYNECLIMYVLGAASPTFPVDPASYHEGWAKNGAIVGNHEKYGYSLKLNHNGAAEQGGPLFWSHYSFLGLDPRNLSDKYANYWEHNVAHTMINYKHCVENPGKFKGYGENCWGLTASYSVNGYNAHMPSNDLGVISPTAALSSMPYSPKESMAAIRHFYENLGGQLFGPFGFYDAFSETDNWWPQKYLAIDQGPAVVMIENYRTGLLWNLFMKNEDVKNGLKKLGFSSQ